MPQQIPFLGGAPATPLPPNAAVIHCDGEYYHAYFEGDVIPPEHQPPAPAPQPPEPDWLNFRLLIFADPAYQCLVLASRDILASTLQDALMADPPYLALLPNLWAAVLQSAPAEGRPTAADYGRWSGVAEACGIPLEWTIAGVLKADHI